MIKTVLDHVFIEIDKDVDLELAHGEVRYVMAQWLKQQNHLGQAMVCMQEALRSYGVYLWNQTVKGHHLEDGDFNIQ